MTTQEILASLSQLEQELQSIKAAKALVDDTVGAYAEVKRDIKNLLNEFESVTKTLNSISSALETENDTLTIEIQNSIKIVKGQLDALNKTFSNQCNTIVMRFMENVNKAATELGTKTDSLTSEYEKNNSNFKSSIAELATVHSSLIKATESVTSLKSDIATLQNQLNHSQKEQDATLEKIASQLQETGSSHAQILSQIANDLKSSQEAQDSDLAEIKEGQKAQTEKLNIIAKEFFQNAESLNNKLLSKLDAISSFIGSKADSIEKKIDSLESVAKSNKTMIIINIAISIITVLAVFLK